MTPNVPTSDSGTATLGMMVAERFRRNRKITITTRPIGEHQLELHVVDGGANGVGAVGQDFHLTDFGQRRGQLRQQQLDPIDHGDDVGAGLPLDIHDHGRRAVHPGGLADVFDIVDDVGDIGQLHGSAVLVGDDQGR